MSPFGQYGGGAVIAISAVTLFYQLSWVLALLVHAANHFPARLRLGGYFRQLVLNYKKAYRTYSNTGLTEYSVSALNMNNAQKKFRAVCFDCDSTLSRLEGIVELASRHGCKDEVALLTEAAMNGELSIDDVYAKRLSIVRPDREAVAWLGERYVQELVPGARETIEALRRLGKPVYVVSGGLLPSVGYLAQALAIPMSQVYAVPIEFDASGAYRGFDRGSPLPRADGKAVVCRELAERHGAIAMVGDGMTDVAARAGGAYVIGFGGVAYRESVATGADCYVAHVELTATLEKLLSEEERAALALA